MILSNQLSSGNDPVAFLLSRLKCVEQTAPKQWRARCPAHDDRVPSLSIGEGDRGQILFHCYAGCSFQEICDAIGPDSDHFFLKASSSPPHREPEAVYPYRDEEGKVLFEVVRFPSKKFRQRQPDGNGGHTWRLNGVRRVLYRLPELVRADTSQPVFVVEGEKDVDRLSALGLAATTCPGGAGKWRDEYSNSLVGRRIVILPDNDEPGVRHAESVARSLHGKAESVKILCLDGIPAKSDVSDWLDAGHTVDALSSLVGTALEWAPQDHPTGAGNLAPSDPHLSMAPAHSWEPPLPLAEVKVPEFPIEAIPQDLTVLREMCQHVAESYQVPLDLPAMLLLAVGSAALAKRIEVHVRGDHWEPVNLYVCVALPPAERKSAVFRAMIEPLQAYEREEVEKTAGKVALSRSQEDILRARLKNATKSAAAAGSELDRADCERAVKDLTEELARFERISSPRLLADDITPEKVVSLMNEQEGRIAILSAEGDVFDMMSGRYDRSGRPNLAVYLKAHAGDDIIVDRVNLERPSEHIARPALTIGITVQPEMVRGLVDRPGFRGRGLIARFLYSLPLSRLGTRNLEPKPLPKQTIESYRFLIQCAIRTPPFLEGSKSLPWKVTLGPEAQRILLGFAGEIEAGLGRGGKYQEMQDWAGKTPGAVARIAGIFHGLRRVSIGKTPDGLIEAETMEAAVRFGRYLIEHAKAVFYMMGADPTIEQARIIADWLIEERMEEVSRHAIYRKFRGTFKTVAKLQKPLNLLEEHGYIRRLESGSKVGRPSLRYELNPICLG